MTNPVSPQRAPNFAQQLTGWFNTFGGQRYGGHILLFLVSVGVIGLAQANLGSLLPSQIDVKQLAVVGTPVPTLVPNPGFVITNASDVAASNDPLDLTRLTEIHTYIPDRSRLDIITYQAQDNDTAQGIADKFGLTIETIVFSNPILNDNPHFLEPGQTLRIAPGNGLIRDVIQGDTLGGLARAYGVDPQVIISWPPNNINPDDPQITVGQALFVPGGTRGRIQFTGTTQNGGVSTAGTGGTISSGGIETTGGSTGGGSTNEPKAPWVLHSGAGQCPGGYTGGVAGSGSFIFPTNHHYISGYNFSAVHPGIDLDGDTGDPAYAADSGVIVFAGWSDWGYGNTIVIDHGNNIWTLYGHLSQIFVQCGQGTVQGTQIGAVGNTGKSQGSHLHFEIFYGVYETDPWALLPPP